MKKSEGFTLLELIVVLTIIGTMSMLIAPSFRISEDSPESLFSPFTTFIEQHRNKTIASGKPAALELDTIGIMRIKSLQKDKKGKYPIIEEIETSQFSVYLSTGKVEKGTVVFYPNGTVEPFSLELATTTKKLLYNGTVARGKIE